MKRVKWIDSRQIGLTKFGGRERLLLKYISSTKKKKEREVRSNED